MDIPNIIKQALNGKTLSQLAREMELSHSTLSLIKNKQRTAGGKVIRALLRHPDTREGMLLYLSQNVTLRKQEVSDIGNLADAGDRDEPIPI